MRQTEGVIYTDEARSPQVPVRRPTVGRPRAVAQTLQPVASELSSDAGTIGAGELIGGARHTRHTADARPPFVALRFTGALRSARSSVYVLAGRTQLGFLELLVRYADLVMVPTGVCGWNLFPHPSAAMYPGAALTPIGAMP